MSAAVARVITNPNELLQQLRSELAEVLTPEQYDEERATQLQNAIYDCRERQHRYRRMHRAAITVAGDSRSWWF